MHTEPQISAFKWKLWGEFKIKNSKFYSVVISNSTEMPGVISVSDFLRETREDLSSPTTSNFVAHIPQCKETVNKLEEVRQLEVSLSRFRFLRVSTLKLL